MQVNAISFVNAKNLSFSSEDVTEKEKNQRDIMNKFAEWIKNSEKKQKGVAQKLGISATTLHDILKKGQIPSLKVAYEIEKYTKGAITVYDWFDQVVQKEIETPMIKTKPKAKKTIK